MIVAGGHQPPGRARPGPAAAGPLRPARDRAAAGQGRARGDLEGPHPRACRSAADVDLEDRRLVDAGSGRRRPAQSRQRGRAAGRAPQRGRACIRKTFLDALEKLVLGPARTLVMSRRGAQRVAYHEGGHTILGLLLPGADPVNRVTIMPRGQALGVTYQRPEDDRHSYSEEYLHARIIGAMGGRVAEEVVYGDAHDRRRKRHAAGDRSGAPDGHALGHERQTRPGQARASATGACPAPDACGVSAAPNPTARRPPRRSTTRCGGCSRRPRPKLAVCWDVHRRELDALAAALLEHETLDESGVRQATGLAAAPASDPIPLRPAAFGALAQQGIAL